MSHVQIGEHDGTVSLGGTFTKKIDAAAEGGEWYLSSGAGAHNMTASVPSGKTGMLVLGANLSVCPPPPASNLGRIWFNSNSAQNAASAYSRFTSDATAVDAVKTCSRPLALDGTAQSVVWHDSLLLNSLVPADAIEYYITEPFVAGRITVWGDDIAAGTGVAAGSRFGAILASWLGMTEDNQGVAGEVLSQGSDITSLNGSTTVTQCGWRRIDAQTSWADRLGEIAIFCEGVHDVQQRGNNDPAGSSADYPYGVERYKQRLRDALHRRILNCPTGLTFVCGIPYVSPSATTSAGYNYASGEWSHGSDAIGRRWSNEIAKVCAEPTLTDAGVFYVDIYSTIVNAGGDVCLQDAVNDAIRPNATGHTAIANAIYSILLGRRSHASSRLTGVR